MPEQYPEFPTEEQIQALIEAGEITRLQSLLAEYHPADIADLLDELPPEYALVLFDLLDLETASEVLDETGSLVRQELVEKVDDERLADLLDELPMDDAAEFLEDLPDLTADRLLGLMEPEEASEVRTLLRYEEETAGRLMSTDIVALRRQWTAAEAVDYLRSLEEAETLHYLYVVDRYNHLIGVVPIRNLILARPEATVGSIMIPDVVAVQVTADQEEMAEFISRYDFVAIPVVDAENRLLGVITVDDALDVLADEATEDIQRLGGSEPLANPYFAVSIWQVVAKRVVWLLPLFAASVLTDTVVSVYGHLLQTFVVLTLFIPVVSATGGNAGSQTVATIIRAIAVGDVRLADLGRAWLRELSIGIILGVILGTAGLVRALLFGANMRVALVLGLTLPLVIVVANSLATLFPIVAERLRLDPTVVSAPLITTLVDATGLFIYFTLASLLLS